MGRKPKYSAKYWNDESKKLLSKFCIQRNIQNSTMKGYEMALKTYASFSKKTLPSLLKEALKEQDNHVPLRETKLKKRLLSYREHLFNFETKLSQRTGKTYLSKVMTFYRHFEVEIPIIPKMSYEAEYVTSYTDLPTHAQLKQALDVTDIKLRSVILFQSSSGSAKAETLSLTVEQFFKGIEEYMNIPFEYNKSVLIKILNECLLKLNSFEMIVPTFYLKRLKTKKYYFTFCSPEATQAICLYLKLRLNKVSENNINQFLGSKLFDFSNSLLLTRFQEINDKLNWGFKGKYRFFRSHVLRKFNASNIGMTVEDIDSIQGRAKNEVHEAYIKTRPEELKKRYMIHMWRICISDEWVKACQQLDFMYCQEYNIKSPEEKAMDKILELLSSQGLSLNPNPTPVVEDNSDKYSDLIKYGELLEKGLITQEEFSKIKQDIIGVV